MTEEQIDDLVSSTIRKSLEFLESQDDSLFNPGDKEQLVDAMKLTHDWFSLPSQWIVTKVEK